MRPGSARRVTWPWSSATSGRDSPRPSSRPAALAVHIPTSEIFPSLNLAQAVQIACYELRRAALGGRTGSYRPVRNDEVDAAVSRIAERLAALGFFRLNQGEELREFLRDTALRAALSPSELRYLESFVHKMGSLAAKAGPA